MDSSDQNNSGDDRNRAMGRSFKPGVDPSATFPWVGNEEYGHTPYRAQGDKTMNTEERVRKRQSLKQDLGIAREINKMWLLLRKNAQGRIEKQSYFNIYLRLCKAFNPDFVYDEAMKVVEEDFERDAHGEKTMSFDEFYESLFELADLWCEDIDARSYATLLSRAFRRITVKLQRFPGQNTVVQVPPIMRAYDPSHVIPATATTRAVVAVAGAESPDEDDFSALVDTATSSPEPASLALPDEEDEEDEEADMRALAARRAVEDAEYSELHPFIEEAERLFRARGLYVPAGDTVSRLERGEGAEEPRRDQRSHWEVQQESASLSHVVEDHGEDFDMDAEQVHERRAAILAEAHRLLLASRTRARHQAKHASADSAARVQLREAARAAVNGAVSLVRRDKDANEWSDGEPGVYVLAPLEQVVGMEQPHVDAMASLARQMRAAASASANGAEGADNVARVLCDAQALVHLREDAQVLARVPAVEALIAAASPAVARSMAEHVEHLAAAMQQPTVTPSVEVPLAPSRPTSAARSQPPREPKPPAAPAARPSPSLSHPHPTAIPATPTAPAPAAAPTSAPICPSRMMLSLKSKFKSLPFGHPASLPHLHLQKAKPRPHPPPRPPSSQMPTAARPNPRVRPTKPDTPPPTGPTRPLRRGLVDLSKGIVERDGPLPAPRDDVPTGAPSSLPQFTPESVPSAVLEDDAGDDELLWGGGQGALLAARSLMRHELCRLAAQAGVCAAAVTSLEAALEHSAKQPMFAYSRLALDTVPDVDDPEGWALVPFSALSEDRVDALVQQRADDIAARALQHRQQLHAEVLRLRAAAAEAASNGDDAKRAACDEQATVLSIALDNQHNSIAPVPAATTTVVAVSAADASATAGAENEDVIPPVVLPEPSTRTRARASVRHPSRRISSKAGSALSVWVTGKPWAGQQTLCLSLQLHFGLVYINADDLIHYALRVPPASRLQSIVDALADGHSVSAKDMAQLLEHRLASAQVATHGYVLGELPCDMADLSNFTPSPAWPPQVVLAVDVADEDIIAQAAADRVQLARYLVGASVEANADSLHAAAKLKVRVAKETALRKLAAVQHAVRHGHASARRLARLQRLHLRAAAAEEDEDEDLDELLDELEDEDDAHAAYEEDGVTDDAAVSAQSWVNAVASVEYTDENGQLVSHVPRLPHTAGNFPDTRLDRALVAAAIVRVQREGQWAREVADYLAAHPALPLNLVRGVRCVHVLPRHSYHAYPFDGHVEVPVDPAALARDEELRAQMEEEEQRMRAELDALGQEGLPDIEEGDEEEADPAGSQAPHGHARSHGRLVATEPTSELVVTWPLEPSALVHPLAETVEVFGRTVPAHTGARAKRVVRPRAPAAEEDSEDDEAWESTANDANDAVVVRIVSRPSLASKLAGDDHFHSFAKVRQYANGDEEEDEEPEDEEAFVKIDIDVLTPFAAASNRAVAAAMDTNLAFTSQSQSPIALDVDAVLSATEGRKDALAALDPASREALLLRIDAAHVPYSVPMLAGVPTLAAITAPALTPTSLFPSSELGVYSLAFARSVVLVPLEDIAAELARYAAQDEPSLKLLLRSWQAPTPRSARQIVTISGYDSPAAALRAAVHVLLHRAAPALSRPALIDCGEGAETQDAEESSLLDEETITPDTAFAVSLPQSVLLHRQAVADAIVRPPDALDEDEEAVVVSVASALCAEALQEISREDDDDEPLPSHHDRISAITGVRVPREDDLEQAVAEQTLLAEAVDAAWLRPCDAKAVVSHPPTVAVGAGMAPVHAFAKQLQLLDDVVLDIAAQTRLLHSPATAFSLPYVPDALAVATAPVLDEQAPALPGGVRPPRADYGVHVPESLPVPLALRVLDLPGDAPLHVSVVPSLFGKYCPVCALSKGKAVSGNPAHSVVHAGQHWLPCSLDCRERFFAHAAQFLSAQPAVTSDYAVVVHGYPRTGKSTFCASLALATGARVVTVPQLEQWHRMDVARKHIRDGSTAGDSSDDEDAEQDVECTWAEHVRGGVLLDCSGVTSLTAAERVERLLRRAGVSVVCTVMLSVEDVDAHAIAMSANANANAALDAEYDEPVADPVLLSALQDYGPTARNIDAVCNAATTAQRKHLVVQVPPNRATLAPALAALQARAISALDPFHAARTVHLPTLIAPSPAYLEAVSTAEASLANGDITQWQTIVSAPCCPQDVPSARQLALGHAMYCPVCLIDQRLLVPAQPSLKVRFAGSIYAACALEHMQALLAAPECYHTADMDEQALFSKLPAPSVWVTGGQATGKTAVALELKGLLGAVRHVELKTEVVALLAQHVMRELSAYDQRVAAEVDARRNERRRERARRAEAEAQRLVRTHERQQRIATRVRAYMDDQVKAWERDRDDRIARGEVVEEEWEGVEVPSDLEHDAEPVEEPAAPLDESQDVCEGVGADKDPRAAVQFLVAVATHTYAQTQIAPQALHSRAMVALVPLVQRCLDTHARSRREAMEAEVRWCGEAIEAAQAASASASAEDAATQAADVSAVVSVLKSRRSRAGLRLLPLSVAAGMLSAAELEQLLAEDAPTVEAFPALGGVQLNRADVLSVLGADDEAAVPARVLAFTDKYALTEVFVRGLLVPHSQEADAVTGLELGAVGDAVDALGPWTSAAMEDIMRCALAGGLPQLTEEQSTQRRRTHAYNKLFSEPASTALPARVVCGRDIYSADHGYALDAVLPPLLPLPDVLTAAASARGPVVVEADFLPQAVMHALESLWRRDRSLLPHSIVQLQADEGDVAVRVQRQILRASYSMLSSSMRQSACAQRQRVYGKVVAEAQQQLRKLDVITEARSKVQTVRAAVAHVREREAHCMALLDAAMATQRTVAAARGIDVTESEDEVALELLHATPNGEESYATVMARTKEAAEAVAVVRLELERMEKEIIAVAEDTSRALSVLSDVHVLLSVKQLARVQKQHNAAVRHAVASVVGDDDERKEEEEEDGEGEDNEAVAQEAYVDEDVFWLLGEVAPPRHRDADAEDEDDEEAEELVVRTPKPLLTAEALRAERKRIQAVLSRAAKVLQRDTDAHRRRSSATPEAVDGCLLSTHDVQMLDAAAARAAMRAAEDAENACRQSFLNSHAQTEVLCRSAVAQGVAVCVQVPVGLGEEPVEVLSHWRRVMEASAERNDAVADDTAAALAKALRTPESALSLVQSHTQLAVPMLYVRVCVFRMARRVWRKLQPWLARVRSLFCKPHVLAHAEALTLLRWGVATLSPVATVCPVQAYAYLAALEQHAQEAGPQPHRRFAQQALTAHSYQHDPAAMAAVPRPAPGLYPVLWRGRVFFCSSTNARLVFAADPYRYTSSCKLPVAAPLTLLLTGTDADTARLAGELSRITGTPAFSPLDALHSLAQPDALAPQSPLARFLAVFRAHGPVGGQTKALLAAVADSEHVDTADEPDAPENPAAVAVPLSYVIARATIRTPTPTSMLAQVVRWLLEEGQPINVRVLAACIARVHFSAHARIHGAIWHSLVPDTALGEAMTALSVHPHILADVPASRHPLVMGAPRLIHSNVPTHALALAHGATEAELKQPRSGTVTTSLPLLPTALPAYANAEDLEPLVPVPIGGNSSMLAPLSLDPYCVDFAYDAGAFAHPSHFLALARHDVHARLPHPMVTPLPSLVSLPKHADLVVGLAISEALPALSVLLPPLTPALASFPITPPIATFSRLAVPEASVAHQAINLGFVLTRMQLARHLYTDALDQSRPAPLTASSPAAVAQALKTYPARHRGYCPVALARRRLVNVVAHSSPEIHLVQSHGALYFASSRAAQHQLVSDMAKYIDVPLPAQLPRMLPSSKRGIRAAHCQLAGACPVCALHNAKRGVTALVAGSPLLTTVFDGKLYRPCGAQCLRSFTEQPWLFIDVKMPVEVAPAPGDEDPLALLQRGLTTAYMQAAVAPALQQVLTSLAHNRVVYPGLSVSQSQLIFMALALKVVAEEQSGASTGARERLAAFLRECSLVEKVTSSECDEDALEDYHVLTRHLDSPDTLFSKAATQLVLERYMQ